MRTKKGTPQVVPHCHTVFLIWRRASEKFDSKRAKTTFLEPTLGGGGRGVFFVFLKATNEEKLHSNFVSLWPFWGPTRNAIYFFASYFLFGNVFGRIRKILFADFRKNKFIFKVSVRSP